jgi:hypothetical protein
MGTSDEEKILDFLKDWKIFSINFYYLIEELGMGWIDEEKDKRVVFKKVRDENGKAFYSQRANLRKKLFHLDESSLIPGTVYSWEKLKVDYPEISSIGHLTPFSLVLEVPHLAGVYHVAKPGVNTHPVRCALFVANDFIEYLTYKYPTLELLNAADVQDISQF